MDAAILIAFITPALFHLGARAKLTQPIHSRYPERLVDFMNCAACAGAWYAMILAALFYVGGWPIFASTSWLTIPIAGLAAIWWVPKAVDMQETALLRLAVRDAGARDLATALASSIVTCSCCERAFVPATPTEGARGIGCASQVIQHEDHVVVVGGFGSIFEGRTFTLPIGAGPLRGADQVFDPVCDGCIADDLFDTLHHVTDGNQPGLANDEDDAGTADQPS